MRLWTCPDSAIFHSDHGSVCTSEIFKEYCRAQGVRQSMGAVGTSADHLLAESFNTTIKREVLKDRKVFFCDTAMPKGYLQILRPVPHQAPAHLVWLAAAK